MIHFCDYGCGNLAQYQLKNGKWCCSKFPNQCITIRQKNSENQKGKPKHSKESKEKIAASHKGMVHSKETRQKISLANKGKKRKSRSIETRIKISKSLTGKKLTKDHIQKLRESHIGIKPSIETRHKISKSIKGKNHPKYGKKLSKKTIKKMSESHLGQGKRTINYIKNKYPTFDKVEEMRYNPDKPGEKEIQVHCKNHTCINSKEQGGWFAPTSRQIETRIASLEKLEGNDGSYFYCSNDCKNDCPIFGKKAVTLLYQSFAKIEKIYTSEEYQIFREEVLNRENYKCEYCSEQATHVHHSRPQKLEPGFALDPDFGVACCENCHYKYGHKAGTECSTGNLANKICNN